MINTPLVSVIMPVFNSANYIEDTIKSVICQSYSNWEIVCVDDGSSDESALIIKKLSQNDSRIRLLHRDRLPKGGSTCRNIGAFKANGDYLIFLDSDDLLASTCIEKRVNIIHNSDYCFVVFPVASFNDGDMVHLNKSQNIKIKDYDYFFASSKSAWQTSSSIFRKDYFISLKGFDESFPRLQDIEFHLRAITQSYGRHKIMTDLSADCFYRLSPSGYNLKKLQSSRLAYNCFVALLCNILEQGLLSDKNKISKSVLHLFCNISIIKYTIWKNGNEIKEWSGVLDLRINKYVRRSVRNIIRYLNKPYNSTISAKFHFYIARLLLHYCLTSFKNNQY